MCVCVCVSQYDPNERASAEEALQHACFKNLPPLEMSATCTQAPSSSSSSSSSSSYQGSASIAIATASESSPPKFTPWTPLPPLQAKVDPFNPDGLLYAHPSLLNLNKTTLQQNHFLRQLGRERLLIFSSLLQCLCKKSNSSV